VFIDCFGRIRTATLNVRRRLSF